jgi:hypothetical protein
MLTRRWNFLNNTLAARAQPTIVKKNFRTNSVPISLVWTFINQENTILTGKIHNHKSSKLLSICKYLFSFLILLEDLKTNGRTPLITFINYTRKLKKNGIKVLRSYENEDSEFVSSFSSTKKIYQKYELSLN